MNPPDRSVPLSRKILLLALLALFLPLARAIADDAAPEKPKIAVFPLGGLTDIDVRTRVGFSLRKKLDRDGTYDPIAGVDMDDMASASKDPITFDTPPDVIKILASDAKPAIVIWGDLVPNGGIGKLRLKILDLRAADAKPSEFQQDISEPTDMRFVVEKALETLPGVKPFDHPNEEAVHHDAATDAAFAKNPNLVLDGDFSQAGHWDAIYQLEKYPVEISNSLPEIDKICIYRLPAEGDEKAHNVLAMNLSQGAAENNGLACLSDAFNIGQGIKYRLRFRYRSDGPTLHVFVKGYTSGVDIQGNKAMREIYRRQISPSGATNGKWVTIECDLNPQHVAFPVQALRVDLYAYLQKGTVLFDDIQLREVGRQSEKDIEKDSAIQPPIDTDKKGQ